MFLAFDTETTGLTEQCNVLTAYFIILDSDLNQVDTLDLKIKHEYYTVYAKALEINKIDLVDHHNASINKSEACLQLIEFLHKNKTDDKYKMLGHNVSYDIKMLKSNNIFTNEIMGKYISDESVDTLTLMRKIKSDKHIPSKQSLSLSKICYYYDIELDTDVGYHNAEYDILMTIELYKKIKIMYF